MSINHLLKQLRVLEALVKEKFALTQAEWNTLYEKHGHNSIIDTSLLPENFQIFGTALSQIAKIGVSGSEPPNSRAISSVASLNTINSLVVNTREDNMRPEDFNAEPSHCLEMSQLQNEGNSMSTTTLIKDEEDSNKPIVKQ